MGTRSNNSQIVSEASNAFTAQQSWRALGGLCLGMFVCFANTTAFNIALPTISVSLAAGQAEQQWMVSSYNLIFAAFMLISGSLGDRWGTKRTLLLGTGASIAASFIGIFAFNSITTIIARGLMGLGAGFYVPMGPAIIKHLFASDKQMRALTLGAIAMTLGAPFGLILGGLLIHFADWRSIFVFDFVAFIGITLLNALLLPHSGQLSCRRTARFVRLPFASVFFALVGLSLLSAGLINAQVSLSTPDSWGLVLAGLLATVLFVYHDTHSLNPLAELDLLRTPSFLASLVALFALNLAIAGILFVLPTYVETVLENNALLGAIMFMPMVGAAIAGSVIAKHLADRVGKRGACIGSLICIALGLVGMALSTIGASYPVLIAGQCVCGLGMGMGLPVMQSWGIEHVSEQQAGGAAALISTFQQIGCLVGISALGSLVGSLYVTACRGSAAEGFASIALAFEAANQDATHAQAIRDAASGAYAHAILITFCITASALLLLAACIALVSRAKREEDHVRSRAS